MSEGPVRNSEAIYVTSSLNFAGARRAFPTSTTVLLPLEGA